MPDIKDRTATETDTDGDFGDFGEADRNSEVVERAARLRQAVKLAGGNLAVAKRAGMPVGTLNRYMKGRDMKAAALVALADGANVELLWLATGRGPDAKGSQATVPPPAETKPKRPLHLFANVDIERLAAAIEGADTALRARGGVAEWRTLTQLALMLYDQLPEREKG